MADHNIPPNPPAPPPAGLASGVPFEALPPTFDGAGEPFEFDPELDVVHGQPSELDAPVWTAEAIQQKLAANRRQNSVQYDDDALPAYRSPELVQDSPQPGTPINTSAIVQEVPPSPSGWSNKADNDDAPPGPMDLDELDPPAPTVGPGLLPPALLHAPLWPIQRFAWEVAVVEIPAPKPLAPPAPAVTSPSQPLAPTPLPATDGAGPTGQLIDFSTPATTLLASSSMTSLASASARDPPPPPPTVAEVRASLPQLPEGTSKGAVLFDTTRWAWWVVPAGDDVSPPPALLKTEGEYALRRLATELAPTRAGKGRDPGDVHCPWWIRVPAEPLAPRKLAHPPPLDLLPTRTASPDAAPAQDLLVDVEPMDVTPADTPAPAPVDPSTTAKPQSDQLYLSATDMRWLILPREPAVRGVFEPELIHEFVRTRSVDPPAGSQHGGETALVVLLTMVANTLFHNEHRAINVDNKNFASKVRWDDLSERILERLGFVVVDPDPSKGGPIMVAPPGEPALYQQTRARLMRAWVELSVFLDEYRYEDNHPPSASDATPKHYGPVQRLDPKDHAYAAAVGALKDKIPRTQLIGDKSPAFASARRALGLNPTGFTVPAAYVSFAYHQQAKFDAPHVARYLQALSDLTDEWTGIGKEDLQILLVSEQSKGLHTQSALDRAFEAIPGLTKHDVEVVIMTEQDGLPADYITKLFGEELQALNKRLPAGSEELSRAKAALIDHLDVIASSRRTEPLAHAILQEAVLQARREPMNPLEAYRVLEATEDTSEEMLQVLFEIRVTDNISRVDLYKDALRSIADLRGSKSLRSFADTGVRTDVPAPEAPLPVSADIPVGLNNIGNTCYLNSLLQYFYTLSELRQIVAQADLFKEDLQALPSKAEKRVGGRVVTRKEIERSIRFIDLLGSLFTSLEFSDTASIEPERELAYLALVTPQDEAVNASEPAPAPAPAPATAPAPDAERTSEDTDITLVEETPAPPALSPSPLRPRLLSMTSSVLGKRSSEDRDDPMLGNQATSPTAYRAVNAFRTSTAMSERSDVTTEPSPPQSPALSPSSAKSPRQEHQESIRHATREMTIEPEAGLLERAPADVGLPDLDQAQVPPATPRSGPPPLPPRKSPVKPFMDDSSGGSGSMMFGKQHDVSECLDNCLFQIDAALDSAKLQRTNSHADSVVKDLFFGKARQAITFGADTKPSAEHDQDVLFNHLLLNVGDTGTSKDLHDSLADYYTPESVEIAGKPALMREVPVKYPALLHLQLQRAQFDRQTGRAYKSNAFLALPEELSLDRYLCPSDDEKAVQTNVLTGQIRSLRDRVLALEQPRGTSATTSLSFLLDDVFAPGAEWLSSTHVDEELQADLAAQKAAVTDEIVQAEAEIARLKAVVEDLWRDDQQTRYVLTSVFMHRGDTGFGHYWLYQRNVPSHPDEWFKYNDSTVTKVKPEEVLSDTGTNATAYLAVFQRADRPGLVDTVHRTLFDAL